MTTNRPLCILGFDSICVRLEGTYEISACPARGSAHTAFQRGPVGPPKHSSWSRAWSPAKTRSQGPDAGRRRRAPSIFREPRGARCPAACAINGFNERKWKPGAGGEGGQPQDWGCLGPTLSPSESSGPQQGTRCKAPRCRNCRERRGHVQGPNSARRPTSCRQWGAMRGGRKQNTFQGK